MKISDELEKQIKINKMFNLKQMVNMNVQIIIFSNIDELYDSIKRLENLANEKEVEPTFFDKYNNDIFQIMEESSRVW